MRRVVMAYLQDQRLRVKCQCHQKLHPLCVFKIFQQEASRVFSLGISPDYPVQQSLRRAVDQVRPAFNYIRGQEANVSIKSCKLSLVHCLDKVTSRSTSGSFADFLVNVCQFLVGAKTLEDDAACAFPWLTILGKENIFYVEDVKKTQSAPRLKGYLPVHKFATPTSAKASRALVKVDESAVC